MAAPLRATASPQSAAGENPEERLESLVGLRAARYAAALGLRPRRATAFPGIVPAQPSQRSAAFAPRRASLNVTRITAPRPSSTSVPQLSQTKIVFRAMVIPLGRRTGNGIGIRLKIEFCA